MKKLDVCFVMFLGFILLAPIGLMAQVPDPPPPPCCPRGSEVVGQTQVSPLVAKGQLIITNGMLQAQGITKREFVERLSTTMFPGKTVDLLLTVISTVNQPGSGEIARAGYPQGLVTVQETRVYRVPLYSLDSAQMESLEQFGLTDGVGQLTVKFVETDAVKGNALE